MPTTYESLATTLGSNQSSVTFSSISSAYTDLILVTQGRNTSSTTNYDVYLQFNSDTGTNYSSTRLYAQGSSMSADALTGWSAIWNGYWYGTNSSDVSTTITQIQNYSNTSVFKSCLTRQYAVNHNSTFSTIGLWRNTNAINTIVLSLPSTQFASGSTFTLYGIKAA
jgi:hypothetical protein